MAKINDIAAAIEAVLKSIPDIGQVYPYEVTPDVGDDGYEGMRQKFDYLGAVRGWHFWRDNDDHREYFVGQPATPHVHRLYWTFHGFWELEDDGAATTPKIDNMVEKIQAAFLADRYLGGTVSSIIVDGIVGFQVVERQTSDFLGVNAHMIEAQLPVIYYT